MHIRPTLLALLTLVLLSPLVLCLDVPMRIRADSSSAPASAVSTASSDGQSRSTSATDSSKTPSTTPSPTSAKKTSSTSATTSAPSDSSSPGAFLDQPLSNGTAGDKDPLPLTPKLTPGLGIAGFVLLVTGMTFCVVGIRSKWLYIFGSAAYLSSLAVVVLICYLMNPPVKPAVQGGYFIAAFFSGLIVGALALVFKEITEGLGCLLGGFCLSMWFLVLKPDGLIGSQGGKAIFIGVLSLAAFSLTFSQYTRNYGLLGCTSFAGATIAVLGIDCFAKAGLKEFWLWLWELNSNIFPLHTNHYPQTRGIRAEIATVILLCAFGIISQIKLWKMVQERRRRKDADRMEHDENLERLDAEVGRRVLKEAERDRVRWEAAYADKSDKRQSYVSVKEMSETTDAFEMSNMSGSDGSMAPTPLRGSSENRQRSADVSKERDFAYATEPYDVSNDPARRYSTSTSHAESSTGASEKPRGGYLDERASLRASMAPPPPLVTLSSSQTVKKLETTKEDEGETAAADASASSPPLVVTPAYNPATGRLEVPADEADETGTTAGLLEEPTLLRKLSKQKSGGVSKSSSFRSAKSWLSNKQNSASDEDLLVPHDDDQRSSVAATLDILDEDQMSLRSRSEHSDVASLRGDVPGTSVRPATANEEDGARADVDLAKALDQPSSGSLVPSADLKGLSGSQNGSKRLSRVSVTEDDDEEELRPAVPSQKSRPVSASASDLAPAELVADHLPDKMSKIALSYRTNEWAKHLEAADAPELEDLPEPESPGIRVDPSFAETVRKESAAKNASSAVVSPAAPATIQADGVKAAAPPLERRQTNPDKVQLYTQRAVPTTIAPQLSRNASNVTVNTINSTVGVSKAAMRSDADLASRMSRSASASNLPKKMKRTSSMPLVDEESAVSPPNPSRRNTLLDQVDNKASRRLSSMPFATANASTPNMLADRPTLSRPASRQLLADSTPQLDDMPLSQRKALIQARRRSSNTILTSPTSPIGLRSPSTPALAHFDSHQPHRGQPQVDPARQEAMLAHWRQSLRADPLNTQQVQEGQDEERRAAMLAEKKTRDAVRRQEEAQKGREERERNSFMRSGNMLDAHREAMRKMQAESRRRSGIADNQVTFGNVSSTRQVSETSRAQSPGRRVRLTGQRASGAFWNANDSRETPLDDIDIASWRSLASTSAPTAHRVPSADPDQVVNVAESEIYLVQPRKRTSRRRRTRGSPATAAATASAPAPNSPDDPRDFLTLASPHPDRPPSPPPPPPPPPHAQARPPQARWSRIFTLSRAPSNPFNALNATPRRAPRTPPGPPAEAVSHPGLATHSTPRQRAAGRDDRPLPTLPGQHRSRQSIPASLVVEPGSGPDSVGRTSIGLPRDRRSFATDRSPVSPSFFHPPAEPPLTAKARGKQRAVYQGDADFPGPTTRSRRPEAPMPPPSAAAADLEQPFPADVEAQRSHQVKRSASRASLPLSVAQGSTPREEHDAPPLGANTDTGAAEAGLGGDDEEYSWGPEHPCFPHPNPHVPLTSPLSQSTRIIRIRRDWMVAGDLAPTFANLYPEVLDPLVSEEAFRKLIRHINTELVAAFSPFTFRAFIDALLGAATGWLWDDLGLTGVKSGLRRLEAWIEEWNRREGAKEGVSIIPLRRTGYITLDFQIPDPHIGVEVAPRKEVDTPMAVDLDEGLDTQRHGDLGPSRQVQDLGALRAAGGQQFVSSGVPMEVR